MYENIKLKMDKALEAFKRECAGLRTGRASVNLLDSVMVEGYGGAMSPINQVASINVPEARLISVQVWDKSLAKNVEKAIRDAGLGLNPASDGQLIRIPIPPLSEERRMELIKVAGKYAETAKVAIRAARRDGIDGFKAEKLSEDEQKRHETEIQKLTDEAVKKVDDTLKEKEAEIKQV